MRNPCGDRTIIRITGAPDPPLISTIPPQDFDRAGLIDQLVQTYIRQGNYTVFFESLSDEELPHYVEPYNLHKSESVVMEDAALEMRNLAEQRQRRLSVDLNNDDTLQDALNQEALLPRTFIRTWVRMVYKADNVMERNGPDDDMWGDNNNDIEHAREEGIVQDLFN